MTKATRKPWANKRGLSRERQGYGRQHVKLRAVLLAQEPLCRPCSAKGRVTEATIADHIVPIAKGGAIYDLSNMQPICAKCHYRKSLIDQGKRPKQEFGPDGWPIEW